MCSADPSIDVSINQSITGIIGRPLIESHGADPSPPHTHIDRSTTTETPTTTRKQGGAMWFVPKGRYSYPHIRWNQLKARQTCLD